MDHCFPGWARIFLMEVSFKDWRRWQRVNYNLQEGTMTSSIFKIESQGRAKPQSWATYNMHRQPSKKLFFFFFCFCFFNITCKSLTGESRSYSYSRYLPHVVHNVSKTGIKIHTDNSLREEAKFPLREKPHVPSVSAQPERQKGAEVTFLFRANRVQIVEVSVYQTLPHSSY